MTSWIENTGTKPPTLEKSVEVEIYLRDGSKTTGRAAIFDWSLDDNNGDILWWRKCSEQSLETAYDVPPTTTVKVSDSVSYKYPETNYTPTAKRSVAQLVADSFNQLSGKNITADEIVSIVTLHEVLKKMEN